MSQRMPDYESLRATQARAQDGHVQRVEQEGRRVKRKTMAEVLTAHWSASTNTESKPFVDKCDGCGEVIFSWGDPTVGLGNERLAAHQAAALSAAGFELVADAKTEAFYEPMGSAAKGWDEGFARATFLAAWAIGSRAGDRPNTTNPHRPEVDRGEG